jgi:iron complex outermembrane receptor protein
MKRSKFGGASILALVISGPVIAQNTQASDSGDIIVTAQRKSEVLQDVPISVSAVTSAMLEKQQIHNSSDLQLSLPNVTFTKTNFTTASFTIRGIGDLCTGTTCDTATASHINEMPLISTRLYESELYDLERVEVLRGPQGTLFGRNATSGVVDIISAKPNLQELGASVEAEYGNFNEQKIKGVINVPLTSALGARFAGYYLKRDGETTNLFNNSKIDGRESYSFRGSLRWQPSSDTTVDLMGYYFRESDNRLRIQKQLCHRDVTGILGCLPDQVGNGTVNGNALFQNILPSKEFISIAVSPALAPFALNSIYGVDQFSNAVNPADARTVNTAFTPKYFSDELQLQGKLEQTIGKLTLSVIAGYERNSVDSEEDVNLAVGNSYAGNSGIFNFIGSGAFPVAAPLLFPNANLATGTIGNVCTSAAEVTFTGVYGGHTQGCTASGLSFDRSQIKNDQWSVETHVNSNYEGPFNFLVGGIYVGSTSKYNEYYVNTFQADYLAALLGYAIKAGAAGAGINIPSGYLASPFYDNDEQYYKLKSYGIYGESYYKFDEKLKLTVGLRYAHDEKFLHARTTLPVPGNATTANQGQYVAYGSSDGTVTSLPAAIASALYVNTVPFSDNTVAFSRLTGRLVLDYKLSRNNLFYASYSRGYKSGGINPPLSPIYAVPANFKPETINAFEIGTKNTLMHGMLRLNASVFYYDYKDLQLSEIVARTAVNQNIAAKIYGIEAEAVLRPGAAWQVNVSASYLKSKVARNTFSVNPQDPSGGNSGAIIIKDVSTGGSNCAVLPTSAATAPIATAIINGVNSSIGLNPVQPIPGIANTGAYSVCSALIANIPSAVASVNQGGVPVNLGGNSIPQAPEFKASGGVQYTANFGHGLSLTPRLDVAYTGSYYASVFSQPIDKIPAFTILNAQIQLNGNNDAWFVRAYVQNLTDNNARTGQYVTDQSQGLFTNIFTLEPRRYGVAIGAKF